MTELLESLELIIDSGDPLPLTWVVKHGDSFDRTWMQSSDSRPMLRIAAHVVPRRQLVMVLLRIARTVLKDMPSRDSRSRLAIETAEGWLRGENTNEEVMAASDAASRAYNFIAYYASYAAIADSATNAGHAAYAVAHAGGEINTAAIVREFIRPTLADLVRAGKNGWNP
jgi:hypothetical protein